jgi:hypothetical protein
VSSVGFLMNLSFPADVRHAGALRDLIAQAVRQAGGEEGRAVEFGERAAALLRALPEQPDDTSLSIVVRLGPPIQVIIDGRTLTLEPE